MGIASLTSVLEEHSNKQVLSGPYERQERRWEIFFVPQQKWIDCFVWELFAITSPYPQSPVELAEYLKA